MKLIQTITALTMLAGLSQASYAAPQTYPLQCRGGGGTLGYDSNIKTAQFYFNKAPNKSSLGLQPGQCAWVDRAIGANEPTCLWQSNINTQAYIFPASLSGSYFVSAQAPWLRSMLKSTTFVTYQAYNPGNGGCFVVTSAQ